ncbi:MAG: CpaF family protein [Planctomycetes bacterium]|nr:CpaF family protein [Planctomycetota bacterium]
MPPQQGQYFAAEPPPSARSTLAAEVVPDDLTDLAQQLFGQLAPRLDLARIKELPEERRASELSRALEAHLDAEQPWLNTPERDQVVRLLLDELLGLGPLEPLLRDPTVSEIMVNGPQQLYVERAGQLEEVTARFRDADHLLQIIERIASRVGRRIDETSPMVDARLPDGSRVNAIIPPLALRGPTLTIRRFGTRPLIAEDLMQFGAFTPEMLLVMEGAIKAKLNVVVSGGTGSGKTTLLNCLSGFIPNRERIVTIEDAAELRLQQRHVVPLETRPANTDGRNAVTMRDLVRNALRMRPDRIIVGECRGAEAFDMLQAMNSGHEGSLTTLHANSPRDALTRLETMILMAGYDMPVRAIRRQIVSAVQLLIQVDRLAGGPRRVTNVTEIVGMEGETIVSQDLFVYQQQGVDVQGRAFGRFVTTGVRPTFAVRLKAAGIDLPVNLFRQRVLLQA